MTMIIHKQKEQNSKASVKVPSNKFNCIIASQTENTGKPWLNSDGAYKSDSEISALCQTWNADIWEEYLHSLEGAQKEDLLFDPAKITEISPSEAINLLFSLMEFKERPHFHLAIKTCLKCLSPQQQKIIELYYWENMRFGEIAIAMGLKRQTITKHHDRALVKLKEMLVSGKVKSLIRMADQTVQNL